MRLRDPNRNLFYNVELDMINPHTAQIFEMTADVKAARRADALRLMHKFTKLRDSELSKDKQASPALAGGYARLAASYGNEIEGDHPDGKNE